MTRYRRSGPQYDPELAYLAFERKRARAVRPVLAIAFLGKRPYNQEVK